MGDGESDEPESLSELTLASREHLDNLIMVVNCNLQRLDGPVRGNTKIVQELEARFIGAGWNVIKCLWGRSWDPLFEADRTGALAARLSELTDGDGERLITASGDVIRSELFNTPELRRLVAHLTDADLEALTDDVGGHDPVRIHAAYRAAMAHRGGPTVILAFHQGIWTRTDLRRPERHPRQEEGRRQRTPPPQGPVRSQVHG